RRHTRFSRDWSSDVCSSDLEFVGAVAGHGALWLNALRMSSGRRMIAAEPDARQTRAVPDWQRELAEAVRDPLELLSLLDLSPAEIGRASCRERVQMCGVGGS